LCPPRSPLFPYTTLFRSVPGPVPAPPFVPAGAQERPPMTGEDVMLSSTEADQLRQQLLHAQKLSSVGAPASSVAHEFNNILTTRSEEHTSELQSQSNIVC